MSESIYKEISEAILNYDQEKTVELTKKAIAQGLAPNDIIDNAVGKTRSEVGNKFRDGELFLPQVVAIASCVTAALDDVLNPAIQKSGGKRKSKGRIVIGTVEGDVHDIGKSKVATMLIVDGFEVVDLGKNVKTDTLVERAQELKADIIAISSLMTTTLPYQRELVEELNRLGLRNQFKVMVGGGPTTQDWADTIRADGYGRDALEAVAEANRILGIKN